MKGLKSYKLLVTSLLIISSLNAGASNDANSKKTLSIQSPNPNSEIIIIESSETPIYPEPPKPTYEQPAFSILNRYLWKVVEIEDSKQNLPIDYLQSLTLDIRPNMLVFKDHCQRYDMSFLNMLAGDYPYVYDGINTKSSCDSQRTDDQDVALSELKKIFRQSQQTQYISKSFGFQWLAQNKQPTDIPTTLPDNAYLAIHLDAEIYPKKSTTIVLKGTIKPVSKTSIENTLLNRDTLERFNWELRQAIDINGKSIEAFNYADIPVIASFYTVKRDLYNNDTFSHASFNSDCNGIGGEYVLTPTNKLLIGYGMQTVMGCGRAREKAEETLRELMHHSTSHLTLNYYPNNKDNKDKASSNTDLKLAEGTYILIQDLDTGEQLIWRSVEKTSKW
ncbi:META domain-containing protein [Psychrobacter sanguinis]|uniref:META domain-containing protein n=1 Tax=Psychrobacter sanguinis TaxID=861445 RepID=UPI00020C7F4A|nr:META domain-containing protein [Psychrobacter sanguinis]EGK07527.1 hypothetical protein HMPREF9373_2558 [Psychrobacter sp. 1501(2011)]MCD9151973.1 META domain-containing protein [Psychrobacter sanguinis]